jgi:hypothetical protein
LLGLNLKLTGKLGRRTKYQEFDIAQLVLDIDKREVQVIQKHSQKDGKTGEEEENKQSVPLEEDSILFEKPKITEEVEDLKRELTVEEQIVI